MFEELQSKDISQNFVGFRAPDSIAASAIWQLPSADGTSGQVLQTNGAGVLSWAALPSGQGVRIKTEVQLG